LAGGILIFAYGVYRLDYVLMILGLLIVAFSVSKIMKSKRGKESSNRSSGT
jgi:hypothetical protein